jgi:hypothetical protein
MASLVELLDRRRLADALFGFRHFEKWLQLEIFSRMRRTRTHRSRPAMEVAYAPKPRGSSARCDLYLGPLDPTEEGWFAKGKGGVWVELKTELWRQHVARVRDDARKLRKLLKKHRRQAVGIVVILVCGLPKHSKTGWPERGGFTPENLGQTLQVSPARVHSSRLYHRKSDGGWIDVFIARVR